MCTQRRTKTWAQFHPAPVPQGRRVPRVPNIYSRMDETVLEAIGQAHCRRFLLHCFFGRKTTAFKTLDLLKTSGESTTWEQRSDMQDMKKELRKIWDVARQDPQYAKHIPQERRQRQRQQTSASARDHLSKQSTGKPVAEPTHNPGSSCSSSWWPQSHTSRAWQRQREWWSSNQKWTWNSSSNQKWTWMKSPSSRREDANSTLSTMTVFRAHIADMCAWLKT